MKIEMMEFLSDKITDINLLKKLILTLDKMSSNNLKRFLDELKRSDYNEYICKMMIDLNEGKEITKEQKNIIEKLKNYDYNENVYNIAINNDVLKSKTIEEKIKLIEELKKCNYSYTAYDIAVDEDVLETRTTEEQIRLME